MVRLNDKEIFRRAFSFGKKSAGGLVEGSVQVPAGAGEFKAWVIATDGAIREYTAWPAVVPGGESRTLHLELATAGTSRRLNVSLR
jgi:hypothetical protein